MPHKIKCAVIGVGVMGKNHLRTYLGISHIQVVGIADPNPKVQEIAQQHNVKYYSDYKQMIDEQNPKVVSICVPTTLHYSIAKTCLKKRINVLLEKPITNNLRTAEKLLQYAKISNVSLLIGHIERHNPAIKKVKQIIETHKLGEITSVISRRVGGYPPQIKDVDIAVDLAIHDIDIINYLLNSLPESVSIHKKNNNRLDRADSVEFFLKYQNSSAFIQANWITPVKIRKINITGTRGYLEMDYIQQTIELYYSNPLLFKEPIRNFSDYRTRFSHPISQKIIVEKKEPLREELLYFIDCVTNHVLIDNRFAVDALKIALKK